jgi:hypothetical protein
MDIGTQGLVKLCVKVYEIDENVLKITSNEI